MFALRPFERRGNLAAYHPFQELENLERAFFGSSPFFPTAEGFRTDIQDKGDHFLLEADLPGMAKENIQLDLDGDLLTIRAERHNSQEERSEKEGYLRCERSYGCFQRSFDVSSVNTEGIEAHYTDGVLQLTLPKKAQQVSTARRLPIQ